MLSCNSCKLAIRRGIRRRCNICDDFDLCGQCFSRGRYSAPHNNSHPYSMFIEPGSTLVPVSQITFTCAACCLPIELRRYHCDSCNNHDLCMPCHEAGRVGLPSHNSGHPVTVYSEPGSIKVSQSHTCEGCGWHPIIGQRWQCQTCPCYQLCDGCFRAKHNSKNHKNSHSMSPFMEPGSVPLDCPHLQLPSRNEVTQEFLSRNLLDRALI